MRCVDVPADPKFGGTCQANRQEFRPACEAGAGAPPPATVQRLNFHSRSRRKGESVSAYVAELRKLSVYCAFGDTLSDILRNRLVCGINDQKLQRRLLSGTALTYDKAFALAQALEAADKGAKELEKRSGIHAVFQQPLPKETTPATHDRKCYRCGGTNHTASDCRFKDSECLHCGKKGHIARVCHSEAKAPQRPQQARRSRKPAKATHHIDEVTVLMTWSTRSSTRPAANRRQC